MENINNSVDILEESHSPSFFQNSRTGNNCEEEGIVGERPERVDGVDDVDASSTKQIHEMGWVKTLEHFPLLTGTILDNHLIKGSCTMPTVSTGPKAFRNKKHGYRLWKEGYVRNIFVKPNVAAKCMLFVVKARVHASMKNIQYTVYVHLDQISGEVKEAICNCKAGQGGCCKHVAALLYALLDFANLGLNEVPADITCTQVAQKWHVPSSANMTLTKAVKFTDLIFEKTEDGKKRKRPIVSGDRDFCATPPFAYDVKEEEIKELSNNLRKIGKAPLFCSAIESNNCVSSLYFDTSCTIKTTKKERDEAFSTNTNSQEAIEALFKDMSDCPDPSFSNNLKQEIFKYVGVSRSEAIVICLRTLGQGDSESWYQERSIRITASLVINRRQSDEQKAECLSCIYLEIHFG